MGKIEIGDVDEVIKKLKWAKRLKETALMIKGQCPLSAHYPDFAFRFDRLSWRLTEDAGAIGPNWYSHTYLDDLSQDMFTEDEQRQIQAIVCAAVLREYGKAAEGLAQYGIELDDPDLGKGESE